MAGMDEKITMTGEWAPNPSPRTLMSNLLNEDFGSKSFSDFLAENGNEGSLTQSRENQMVMSSKENNAEDGFHFSNNFSLEPSLYNGQKSLPKGGLAQRMARSGFNAPTINTSCIVSANIASATSDVRSPYLTIPPGLSPTTLLESPVFLSNSMVQPSPTTGKILFAQGNNTNNSFSVSSVADRSNDDLEDIKPGGFAFNPPLNASSYFPSPENRGAPVIDQPQSLHTAEATDSFVSNENSPPLDDQSDVDKDVKEEFSSAAIAAPAEDGYSWRKYGQKQVKGSEHPRSYYKCTHANCQVKKKVERSQEGHVTEIIYKGAHNHPKPPLNRRAVLFGSENPCSQWTSDGMEVTSSASVTAEYVDHAASVPQDGSRYTSPDAIDVSSTLSNEEDRATHGSASVGGDGEGDETESKRRKLDACNVEMSTASRGVREPRVVVQTTSEVDILDDGYRWRKYGQKVVKGNPNPRSYYKCTSAGCNVRKHVERASHDLKAVITTYEGKHNHDVPAARNSAHSNSGPSSAAAPLSAAQPQILHRRPDSTRDGIMRFDARPPLGAFGLPNMGAGLSFGMGQQGFGSVGIGGFGPYGPVKMPVIGPLGSYVGANWQGGGGEGGLVEPKEESVTESGAGVPVSSAIAAYHQLVNRYPLGPQL